MRDEHGFAMTHTSMFIMVAAVAHAGGSCWYMIERAEFSYPSLN